MLKERFLKYVQVYTTSSEESTTSPSTHRQFDLAHILRDELLDLGLEDVKVSDHCIVTGSLPGSSKESLGLIAHMDTSPDFSGQGIKPQIIENYDGGPIHLKGADLTMDPKDFPDLKDLVGKTVITSDGTTLLGADDKAGVAAIMEVLAYYVAHPDIPRPSLKVAFTPDEEVGRGTENFDVQDFACDYALTVDGGGLGEFSIENFNAASATVTIQGLNIHPGSAKDKMVNALDIATDFHQALPVAQRPQHTEGREGFIHLHTFSGSIEEAQLNYIIRDFDPDLFQEKKDLIQKLGDFMAEKHHTQIQVDIKDSYYNMKEKLDKVDFLIQEVLKAMEENSVPVRLEPIRGGTDGAMLSYKGLPCPNLFTGGHHFHGRYECIALEDLQKAVDVLISLVASLGQRK
ncbi:Peptidase T [Urinicoccus massiliensis]|uniref:Peptidase T n=1 Tax=Urinicoccus massiliensis TaxID=1723382 RepID=A0A8H2M4F9_9FIRM|nr:peptidase T [Urinicoccus massiliensis]VFB15728.1 Peptidase T [Urinicoccus massiliensis]